MNDLIQQFTVLLQDVLNHPGTSLAIIGNLIIIESLLSVDNAAVLATMVMDLPKEQRGKALKYGIWGAYIFRGLAMLFVAILIKIWWLKAVGGLYLIYLVYDWWKGKQTETTEDDLVEKENKWFYKITKGTLGIFWSTVIAVEIMDMAFSIDNVFAAVAFTPNIILVCLGVFIGIFAMRFIAQWFVKLMEKYTFLETCAFSVIAILGLKLVSSAYSHFYPCSNFAIFMEGNVECLKSQNLPLPVVHEMPNGDIITSIITVVIFFVPIITSIIFNFPKKQTKEE
jgi:YkoY family integral membrane protein